jgi:hypothetical protein
MDPSDDYLDEMGRLRPDEIEAIISRREAGDSSAEPLAALVREVRRDLLENPTAPVAARHLAAMNEAQRKDKGSRAIRTSNDGRDSMRPISQRRLAAVATAVLLLLGAGVAAAVTLPDNASETAKNAVSNDNAEHGQAVSDTARNTSLQGCEKSQAIAAQASGKTIPANDPCSPGVGGGNPNGDNGGNGANDTNGTPQGSGGGSGGPGGGGGGGGGSQTGSGGGSGGPGGGGGGGGSQTGSGGGSGGPGGGGGSGGSEFGGGGGSGGPGGGSGSGGPSGSLPTP